MPIIRRKYRAIPNDTRGIIDLHYSDCKNLGLLLDKYQPWTQFHQGNPNNLFWDLTYKYQGQNNNHQFVDKYYRGGAAKNIWIRNTEWLNFQPGRERPVDMLLNPDKRIDNQLYSSFLNRWKNYFNPISNEYKRLFELQSAQKIVVGLGEQNTLEMGLRLHKVYGFPIIPGSSLKGLARSWALFNLAQAFRIPSLSSLEISNSVEKTPLQKLEALIDAEDPTDENINFKNCLEELQNDQRIQPDSELKTMSVQKIINDNRVTRIRKIFGTISQVGCITFWDGVATTPPEFSLEIINPHFQDYYQSGEYPKDDQSPVPINNLTLKAGTIFLFGLTSRKNCIEDYLKLAKIFLYKALTELGIGGKTSNGMGYFFER